MNGYYKKGIMKLTILVLKRIVVFWRGLKRSWRKFSFLTKLSFQKTKVFVEEEMEVREKKELRAYFYEQRNRQGEFNRYSIRRFLKNLVIKNYLRIKIWPVVWGLLLWREVKPGLKKFFERFFAMLKTSWRWFAKTEWGAWAIERLSPWVNFGWVLTKFLARKFISLNAVQKGAVALVIFALVWQSGLSALAEEIDPMERVATPEMKVLKDVNPELLQSDNFAKEKKIAELIEEESGKINYNFGGLLPATNEDKVKKEEVKILTETKENLRGGLLSVAKAPEVTVLKFVRSKNPRVQQAALNVRDLLRSKGLYETVYDEQTGEEKEILTQLDTAQGKIKPGAVPFDLKIGTSFSTGMEMGDISVENDQLAANKETAPDVIPSASDNVNYESQPSPEATAGEARIMNYEDDQPSPEASAWQSETTSDSLDSEFPASPAGGVIHDSTNEGQLASPTEQEIETPGVGGFNSDSEFTATSTFEEITSKTEESFGNDQFPISNFQLTSDETTPSVIPAEGETREPADRQGEPESSGATNLDSRLRGNDNEENAESAEELSAFTPKTYKITTEEGEKILVDKTPENKESISFRPLQANDVSGITADNKVLFKNAWTGMDVLKTVTPEGVKEDIIIKDKSASTKLYFEVKTKGLQMRVVDGGLGFYDIFGNLKFSTPQPFMVDRYGNARNLEYKLVKDSDLIKEIGVEAEGSVEKNTDNTGQSGDTGLTGEDDSGRTGTTVPTWDETTETTEEETTIPDVIPSVSEESLDSDHETEPISFWQNVKSFWEGGVVAARKVKNVFALAYGKIRVAIAQDEDSDDTNTLMPTNDTNTGQPSPEATAWQSETTSGSLDSKFVIHDSTEEVSPDGQLTEEQQKRNEIIENLPAKSNDAQSLTVFDDVVHQVAEYFEQGPNWVLAIFSDEQIKLIAQQISQLTDTGQSGEDDIPGRTGTTVPTWEEDWADEIVRDLNEERTYVVVLELDFSGLAFPIDLDPTTYIYLQDRGQATFHADFSGGTIHGNDGLMNGYGVMTRGNESFLPQGSLVGYWPMDNNWNDYSGNSNNGTASGNATFNHGGKFSYAGQFDGDGDYATVANEANFDFERTDAFSIGGWIKTSATGVHQAIFGKMQGSTLYAGYSLEINLSGLLRFYAISDLSNTNYIDVVTSSTVNDGSWHHVFVTYDGSSSASGVNFYLDGSLASKTVNTDSLSGTILNNISPTIGLRSATYSFNGNIDELGVWKRTLSTDEIAKIANNGRVENTSSAITYVDPDGRRIAGKVGTNAVALETNSYWMHMDNANYSGGNLTQVYTGTASNLYPATIEKTYAEFTFTGTEVWLGTPRSSVQRIAKAVIDPGTTNEVVTYINRYNSAINYGKFLIATGLSNSSHTVRVYPTVSHDVNSVPVTGNSLLVIDYFEYYTSGYELAQKSAITINSRETNGFNFLNTKDSPAISYAAAGNIPQSTAGKEERGSFSTWIKTNFAWNSDNAPHYVWGDENQRVFYQYDSDVASGTFKYQIYNGTDWTTVAVDSADYTAASGTFASGDVFHLATTWDANLGASLYVNNVKTSYASSWTPQTASGSFKFGGDEQTKLLLHADGENGDGRDIDASGNGHALTFTGDAKISTTQSKFGGSSYYFDGTGDYISIPDSDDWDFGSGDFTIDFWVRHESVGDMTYVSQGHNNNGAGNAFYFQRFSGALYFSETVSSSWINKFAYAWTPTVGTWYHLAVVQESNTLMLFIDGVLVDTDTSSVIDDGTYDLRISSGRTSAADSSGSRYFNGQIDEFRISKDIARWTSNFTPPAAAAHSNFTIAEPTIFNYVLTDAEVEKIYESSVGMPDMISGLTNSADAQTQQKLFAAASRVEEANQTTKSLLFNFPGVQTADARVGAFGGSLYKTAAPTGPSTTVAESAVTFSGTWTDNGNNRTTTDTSAYATYTTAGNATELWATYYAGTAKGIAEYIIDEGTAKEVRTKIDQYASGAADRYALIATGLENTTHTIKVRMLNNRNPSSTANGICVGLNGTADRMFYYGTTPDIATQDMVVNGQTINNVLTQDYATMPTATNFQPKGNISQSANEGSISVWAQTTWAGNDSTSHYIFESRSASALSGISLFKNSSNLLTFYWYNATTATNLYSPALTAANWAPNVPHHIVIKWWRPTSTTVGQAIYLDGVKLAETKSVSFTPNASSLFMIGNATTATNETNDFDGAIYDFSVWSWAFDDGGVALGSMVSPISDVGKSYQGLAVINGEDLSSQVDGTATTFKLNHGLLERDQPNDNTWIWAQSRTPQSTFGYNMAYDTARDRWYSAYVNYIYYSSGPDPKTSGWSSVYIGATSSYNFSKIYYDSVYDRWIALGTLTGSGEWSAYLWYSSTNDPLNSTWTIKTISAGSNSESPWDLVYDSANSRWMVVGSYRVEPADTPHYAWLSYSSGPDLSTATWTFTWIATASSNQQAFDIEYDSTNGYWYVSGSYLTGVNNAVVWYSTNPTGGTGAWTMTTVQSGGTPNATGLVYDSVNARWIASGYSYLSTYNSSLWYSSGSNLTDTTWVRKDIDTDSDQEYSYSIVKDPNQSKYYVSMNGSTVGGFWTVEVSSDSSSALTSVVSVKDDNAAATVSAVKAGTSGVASGAFDFDDTAIKIEKSFYEADGYDRLLIHSNSTDGNAVFGDATGRNTITTAGNTHHETDAAKFGPTSIYFDGTGDYLYAADSSNWDFSDQNFTIDFWANFSSLTSTYKTLINHGYYTTEHEYLLYWDYVNGYLKWLVYNTDASAAMDLHTSDWSPATGTWYHVALVRNGNNWRIYINGEVKAETTQALTIGTSSATNFYIGSQRGSSNYFQGYLDEFRLAKGIARWTTAFDPMDPPNESEIDTTGGYLQAGWPGANRQRELIEYSSYDTATNTFTVSQRGVQTPSGEYTYATSWPDNTPIEVGGTVTLSAAPETGSRLLASYNFSGDELARDRGDIKNRLNRVNFLDVTEDASTGWDLSGYSSAKSGGQQISTQVAGQNALGYFWGTDLAYIFSGDSTNGGVAMVVVDEGTAKERRVRSDQNSSTANQLFYQLSAGLSPGYHTFRLIGGVDETNAGSNKYTTFDAFVAGAKADLGQPSGNVGDDETKDSNDVNDTFYWPAWEDESPQKGLKLETGITSEAESLVLTSENIDLSSSSAWGARQNLDTSVNGRAEGIIYDSVNARYYAVGYHHNGTDYDAVLWYSSSNDPITATWTRKTIDNSAASQYTYGIYYDSVNSRYYAFGQAQNGSYYYSTLWYSSSSDLTTATWTRKTIDNSAISQRAQDVYYDSVNSRYYAFGTRAVGTLSEYQYDATLWYSSGNDLTTATWTRVDIGTTSYDEMALGLIYDPINSLYYAVGYYYYPSGIYSVLWYSSSSDLTTAAWTRKQIDPATSSTNIVYDIIYDSFNDRYYTIGYYRGSVDNDPALWYSSGNDLTTATWTRVDIGQATNSEWALGIVYNDVNSRFTIVGQYWNGSDYDAVLWNTDIHSIDLDNLGRPDGIIKIGEEKIKYGTISSSAFNQVTLQNLERGYVGTTAASHSADDGVVSLGGWRNNVNGQNSSWYRTFGPFPERALLVGTGSENVVEGGVAVINLEDNTLWGRFEANANNAVLAAPATISAANGKLFVGYASAGYGLSEIDFVNDRIVRHKSSAGVGYGSAAATKGGVAEANNQKGWSYTTVTGTALIATGGDYVGDVESYYDSSGTSSTFNIWVAQGRYGTTGTSAGISYTYDEDRDGITSRSFDLTADTGWWVSNIYYDSTNDDLYVAQTKGTAGDDVWSKISSPKLTADSTIDTADGSDRLASMSYAFDITADASNVYFATADGVKKVSKSSFSSGVTDTLNASDFSELPSGNDAYTKLLLHADGFQNQGYDVDYSASQHELTFNGDAKISTTQKKFGESGYYFDGTGDYISISDSDDWDFGSGDFTIDFWFRGDNPSGNGGVISYFNSGTGYSSYLVHLVAGDDLRFFASTDGTAWNVFASTYISLGSYSNSQFDHFSVVRSGNIFSTYKNGVLQDSETVSATLQDPASGLLYIGRQNNSGTVDLKGYIDEPRVSKGIARWTSDFSVPTEPHHSPVVSVDYSNKLSRLISAFKEITVTSTVAGGGPVYYDSTTETDVDRNDYLAGSFFKAVSWLDNMGSDGFAVGSDDGVSIATWSEASEPGAGAKSNAPGIGNTGSFLIF